jgi:diacylglycerol kinase (ATP)
VVYNPAKVDLAQLTALLDEAEADGRCEPPLWFETAADDDGRQAAADAAAAAPSCVLAVGGDGTVRVVAEQLAGTAIPLAVGALGTGNLLARALRLPLNDLAAAVESALTGAARAIDLGRAALRRPDGSVSSHAFLVMAGIGLDARMAADTSPRLKKHVGWLAYADPISRSIVQDGDFALHYRVDGGRRRSTRAHTVIVGNCGTLTGGVLLIPDARPDDGILDTVMLRPSGARGWAQIGIRLLLARFLHRTAPGRLVRRFTRRPYALRYGRARRITVAFSSAQEVELDGDGFGAIMAAKITVEPGALQLIC